MSDRARERHDHDEEEGPPRPRRRRPSWVWRWTIKLVWLVLLGPGSLYVYNWVAVHYGKGKMLTLADAWKFVNLDSLQDAAVEKAELAADAVAPAAPAAILDTLVQAWRQSTNAVTPHLVVLAAPTKAGDVTVVLNPAVYRLWTPAEQSDILQNLAETWRTTLATSAAVWPSAPGYQPGVIVLRHESDRAGAPAVVVAEARDGRVTIYVQAKQ
jgi:hypothetical protein